MLNLIQKISNQNSFDCLEAERAALKYLNGSCHSPMSAFARYNHNKELIMSLALYTPDGKQRADVHSVKKNNETIEVFSKKLAKKLKNLAKEWLHEIGIPY